MQLPSPAGVLAEQGQVRRAEPVGGGVGLVPVRVDQRRHAHLVQRRALVAGEDQVRRPEVVRELRVGARGPFSVPREVRGCSAQSELR
jgi:hypothetical protein